MRTKLGFLGDIHQFTYSLLQRASFHKVGGPSGSIDKESSQRCHYGFREPASSVTLKNYTTLITANSFSQTLELSATELPVRGLFADIRFVGC